MSRLASKLKKGAILTHRWMGVTFCLLFAAWFASGIVMIYWDYPKVTPQERLARARALDPFLILVSPQEAFAKLGSRGSPDQVWLAMFDKRPAYFFIFPAGQGIVYADTGELQREFSPEATRRIAATWTGQTGSEAKHERVTEQDQWTVSLGALGVLDKFSWRNGEQVYVSAATGQVVQYTTRSGRVGAWLGAIPHWLYFADLRKNRLLWRKVVIGSSGFGTLVSLFGLVVGFWMYSPSKRYRSLNGPSHIPYTGQKRWHTIFGLTFGFVTCTWAFSGMMSMDPIPSTSGPLGAPLKGKPRVPGDLTEFVDKEPREALRQVPDLNIKELEFTSFDGQFLYLASEAPERTRIIPVHGEPYSEFDRDRIVNVVAGSGHADQIAEVREISEYETYYVDRRRRQLPLPVVLVRMTDKDNSMYYVDPKTGRLIQSYTRRSRLYRWLYHGLHSIDLPWLYKHRPAWDILVLALMSGGTALSATSVVIAWRRLRLKFWLRRTAESPPVMG